VELRPEEVVDRFGKMFSQGLLTLVDKERGVVEIVEQCSVRGTVEWDLANRLRAGGVIEEGWVDGTALILRAKIGTKPVSFGSASAIQGGQALEKVVIKNGFVYTHWAGIAGGGLGLAVCLPQAPGVIKAIYPTKGDLTKVGGAHTNRVIIVTPEYSKVIVGIDDTDVKDKGATWASTLKVGRELEQYFTGLKLLSQRIFQSYPEISWKTTNNVSMALSFALPPNTSLERFVKAFIKRMSKYVYSDDACMTVYNGIEIPEKLRKYTRKVKSRVVKLEEAERLADQFAIKRVEITGKKGLIGALAALAYYDAGLECAALADDPALRKVRRQ